MPEALCPSSQLSAEDDAVLASHVSAEFGRKLRILIDLLKNSSEPRKAELFQQLRIVRKAKREIITHSYIMSKQIHVTLIYRYRGGDYRATKHEFSINEFEKAHHYDAGSDSCVSTYTCERWQRRDIGAQVVHEARVDLAYRQPRRPHFRDECTGHHSALTPLKTTRAIARRSG
jgi:hypothetical protein